MALPPSQARQLGMLQRLRTGMVLAAHDHAGLRYLEFRRYVRAYPLFDPRNGKPLPARAWQITDAGTAAALRLAGPRRRKGSPADEVRQIDIEEHLAAPGAERRPEATPHPVPDAPAVPAAGVSAHEGRPSRRSADRPRGARGRKPETATP